MLADAIGNMLPATMAIALTPIQIVAVVVVLGGPKGRAGGFALVIGWLVALGALVTVAILLVDKLGESGRTPTPLLHWLQLAASLLLLAMAMRMWHRRPKDGEEPATPKQLASLGEAGPVGAFVAGASMAAANPKIIALVLSSVPSISGTVRMATRGRSHSLCAAGFDAPHHPCSRLRDGWPGDRLPYPRPQRIHVAPQRRHSDGGPCNAWRRCRRKWSFGPSMKPAAGSTLQVLARGREEIHRLTDQPDPERAGAQHGRPAQCAGAQGDRRKAAGSGVVSIARRFGRKSKEPTPLEIAADAVNREADCAFSDRKEALRAAARRLGIPIGESTEELIDAMETVAK